MNLDNFEKGGQTCLGERKTFSLEMTHKVALGLASYGLTHLRY